MPKKKNGIGVILELYRTSHRHSQIERVNTLRIQGQKQTQQGHCHQMSPFLYHCVVG